ncbi:hypothetical protein X777_03209, partial [Ooceraea biroi]
MLGALGSLAAGAAGVAKAVNDSKAVQRQLQELHRHHRAMEGRGLYFASYKNGQGLYLAPYKRGQSAVTKKKKRQKGDKDAYGFSIMSLTLTLTGRSSILAVNYFPSIDLSDGDYELGLMDFETYHTIPNVNASNNKFYFGEDDAEITILEGSYELRDINKFL